MVKINVLRRAGSYKQIRWYHGGVQGLDRYAYSYNNPVKYTNPSGYTPCYDSELFTSADCLAARYRLTYGDLVNLLKNDYGWSVSGFWSLSELYTLYDSGSKLENYINSVSDKGNGGVVIKTYLGGTNFINGGLANIVKNTLKILGFVPWKNQVELPDNFNEGTIIHEIGHILDNKFKEFRVLASYVQWRRTSRSHGHVCRW